MRPIHILTMLCALVPTLAVAKDAPTKAEATPTVRGVPASTDTWLPGVLRQDLFDRNNPRNLRHDYHAPPAQPGQF